MKNNTSRVRPDAATQRPASQAQTVATPGKPAPQYVLSLVEWNKSDSSKHITLGEIDINPGDFDTLKANSKTAGDHTYRGEPVFTNLLNIGFQAMVNAFPPCALENAVAANNALLQLVSEHAQLELADSGASMFTGPNGGELCFGLCKLTEMCREQLNRASGVAS